MSTLHRMTRAGALALAGLAAASVASGASPEQAQGPSPARGELLPRLVPLPGVEARSVAKVRAAALPAPTSRLTPADLPPSIERLTEGALAREEQAGGFPVSGPFNWGQDGARFGAGRGGRAHEGQDVFGRTGAALLAVSNSVVLAADEDAGRGNYVGLYDPSARRTYVYLHLQRRARARPGQHVRSGELIGELGCTGSCSGDHLHFEVRRGRGLDAQAEDPLPHLLRWARRSGVRPTLPPGAH